MLRFATKLLTISSLALAPLAFNSAAYAQATRQTERQLAPGVLTTISPSLDPDDTVSTHDVMEIRANPALNWNPEFLATSDTLVGMSSAVKFRREIYCLEFSFKPMRMIDVEVPTASGGTERKLVWYLMYCVRNTGNTLKPVEGADGVYSTEPGKGGPVKFVPQFVLESQDRTADGKPVGKAYLDRVIPAAVDAISRRESPGKMLLNTVEMAEQPIPVSDGRINKGVWGVATWTDIDPRIDFFAVFVGGLTNAYQWTDNPAAFKPGDPPGRGRRFKHKVLQLNFWRPGDELQPNEREIRYGVPLHNANLYDVGDGVAYRWVYR